MLLWYESYSTKGKKSRLGRILSFLVKLAITIAVAYFLITTFFFASFRVQSISMEPGLRPGDRLFASPLSFGVKIPFVKNRIKGLTAPQRGDLVVILAPGNTEIGFFKGLFDPIVRFLTFQRRTVIADREGESLEKYLVKRIIGIPGDTIKLEGFEAFIMTGGAADFQSESAVIETPFEISLALPSDRWFGHLPFSGNMGAIILEENQFFVLGDNRPYSSDSRSWGPIPFDNLAGKLLFRYWPLNRLGGLLNR